jgi:hypothetical protein
VLLIQAAAGVNEVLAHRVIDFVSIDIARRLDGLRRRLRLVEVWKFEYGCVRRTTYVGGPCPIYTACKERQHPDRNNHQPKEHHLKPETTD